MSGDLRLDWCRREAAVHACERWHYSACAPAGKLVTLGAYEGGEFVGAVVFGRGANNNIGSRYGLEQTQICELVRIALRRHDTPVSRIIAVALRLLRRQSPGLRLVVSYADPVQGHHGGVYQAAGWLYAGASQAQRELIVNGANMHKRTAGSRWGTASPTQLRRRTGLQVDYGPKLWKHTYLMPLDAAMRAQIAPLMRPYPKRPGAAERVDDGSQGATAHADAR